jgi:hypothetical protein
MGARSVRRLTRAPRRGDGTDMTRAHEYGYWYYLRPPPGAGVFVRD